MLPDLGAAIVNGSQNTMPTPLTSEDIDGKLKGDDEKLNKRGRIADNIVGFGLNDHYSLRYNSMCKAASRIYLHL